ncbi:MAG: MBL fold metallo-hydrolase [Myxococcales bacterium]|nr:MBL fold metallo-hydrolase [Myxococcales bacterium]
MLFRQFLDPESSTYSYLVASRPGGEALLVDPVDTHVSEYLTEVEAQKLRLVRAVDTHVHADHVTGLGHLRDATGCITAMGEQSKAACVTETFRDGDVLELDGLRVEALYTPGHTDDSYCFRLADRVLTGDTLLIGGTGRTDFQNGDARAQWDSIMNVLLKLPDATRVFPGHDYRGRRESTIGEERRSNPRLQVPDVDAYVALMASLNLPNPKLMDIAVPANLACGTRGAASTPAALLFRRASARAIEPARYRIIDVREPDEFGGELGHLDGAELVPLAGLLDAARDWPRDKPLLIVCRSGRRSARAAQSLASMGFWDVTNLEGGMLRWNELGRAAAKE